ncbi:23S rRNA (uracil(1939)-C(5))-methyltransferase RlmD [Sediminicurvatus halobius]|uniref:23S rRNA (uracil(1939)-C(5))-methyltransferase RlmD n=1 Tax=Sediminicurvatus halobius TaxID=2182432 RepID=A0A2U2N935_9GAMM|nr:23S rRNA (uracil(1939)-C(5))-methyltransferase RlmD [Spiribacter halobius]PWG65504.1 23S rRNA (uracil(1939)-C(5))-methyltransferase RlmD [Spiribacter halobius]UEX76528.1 23S rRNA (uracil(1939)-C(5))-methyltransferase RlmD [Spiribacter halobius]
MARRRRRVPSEPLEVVVEGMSHEGRGIAHADGRTVFIDGALPGERVQVRVMRRKRRQDEGRAEAVLAPSPQRVTPPCAHFGVCGGCSLQHLAPEDQLAHKAGVVAELLRHVGGVAPEEWLPPLTGPSQGYRRRARLGVKYVPRKGDRVLVGFREKYSPYVADIESCLVLDPRVGERLPALADLVRGLSIPDRIAQIEVACGDDEVGLVLRNLAPLSADDRQAIEAFGARHGLLMFEQPGNERTVAPLGHTADRLHYRLPEAGVSLAFAPTDFTQVNGEINRRMVPHALELLAPTPQSRVLDLFCGLGNFSLPLAREAREVIGVEGAEALVARGRENAARNGIDNVAFHAADLTRTDVPRPWLEGGVDRVLLDPPRSGAVEVLPALAALGPERIVYVSCGPATLARDAGHLVHDHGYRLAAAGVMDMFPHTGHVEAIALFQR